MIFLYNYAAKDEINCWSRARWLQISSVADMIVDCVENKKISLSLKKDVKTTQITQVKEIMI